jgi:hypothetical protein
MPKDTQRLDSLKETLFATPSAPSQEGPSTQNDRRKRLHAALDSMIGAQERKRTKDTFFSSLKEGFTGEPAPDH